MILLVLASLVGLQTPLDADYRAALDLLYDGSTDTAIARIDALAAAAPEDPVGPYLGALALLRKIGERPESASLDAELRQRVTRALAQAEARLAELPRDVRGLFARAGARGVASRFAFVRGRRKDSAREGARMREDLLVLRELAPDNEDVLFGLGLYDYYVDVLPRLMKFLRFIMGLPGGDRERGLAELERAKAGSLFHEVEARDQLYRIYAFYERKPDRALEEIQLLRKRYPGSPLWALQLAEHERDRMGLYAESAAVAREILEACRKRHANCAPVLGAMARVGLGESLLLDLRLADAQRALLPLRDGAPEAPWIGARARFLLGRALELEGDREAALPHYREAAASDDRDARRRAKAALESPLPEAEVRAAKLLADARRLRESGREEEAAPLYRDALRAWPRSDEAALRVAEDELRHGRVAAAREILDRLAARQDPEPPWVRPWSRLLLARALDLAGDREAAVSEYKQVWQEPWGQDELRSLALGGLRRPYEPDFTPVEGSGRAKHSR